MYKFYWSNLQQKGPSSSSSSSSSSGSVSGPASSGLQTRETEPPTGSQRVLLKLRKLSNSQTNNSRPKSVPADLKDPRDLILLEGKKNPSTMSSPKLLPSSQSHHQFFYNKTWNESTLRRHNRNHKAYYDEEEEEEEEYDSPPIIHQLKGSPNKKNLLRRDDEEDLRIIPVPPARTRKTFRTPRLQEDSTPDNAGNRNKNAKNAVLYRSKSCERPKKKDTFRFHDNLSRISSNLTERFKTNKNAHQRREDFSNENSRINGDDRTSILTQGSNSGEDEDSQSHSVQSGNNSSTLANKMRGFRHDVQKRLSRFRSRSAERISNKTKVSSRSPPSSRRMTTTSLPTDDFRSKKYHHHKPPMAPPPPIAYNGPFIGTARALVDCTPSPYDVDALRFKRGDRVDIISMNPNGLWKGKCEGRIGNFKFINVEVLRPERKGFYVVSKSQSISNLNNHHNVKKTRHDSRESEREESDDEDVDGEEVCDDEEESRTEMATLPKSVDELLKRIGLEEHISVFVLNGYEDLEHFMEIEESELDYLGIMNVTHRNKIMSAVDLLLNRSETPSNSGGDSDVTLESASPPPVPTIAIPRDSGVFNEADSDESWSISSSYSTPLKNKNKEDEVSIGIGSLDLNNRDDRRASALSHSRTLNFHFVN